ncbi:hypothetical protein HN51_031407 [Arachis hypogaea]|uniref:Uncharacterized protein n=1 Tax=Arachis hypogaea TaxID=3818 RepID=A0A445B7A4_ARAHY|nr:kinetochore-associated protein KNL-2 homolog [Arachis hypogaea]QHO16015.1 uncharacterized protein DS421_10g299930 [Arachis hypogaea]RYR34544.1 hypothetical protein Ahy_A10g049493 isoform A [Arachis hypogaea]
MKAPHLEFLGLYLKINKAVPGERKLQVKKVRSRVNEKGLDLPLQPNIHEKRGLSPSIIGEEEKISSVSILSSFKKSRSGRLLLPPLEFWRNQIPIYNADHVVTEIQGGASLVE